MNGFISVILPFRNAAATIDAALSGLLAESDPAREVIAIDDGSSDGGALRVQTWAARDPRVKLITSGGVGLVQALERGVRSARGALIARMDADDLSHRARLSRQRAHLEAHPELAVLGTAVEAFVDQGELGEGMQRYVAWQNAILTPEEHALARFIESPLCHPSIMMRRDALLSVGGYRELDGPEDYELFLRFSAHGYQLAKLPETLLSWRHHRGRATFADGRYALDKFRAVKAPHLARVLLQRARRLVVWGAGPTGRRLARALAHHGATASLFVDIDPRKLGRTAQGAPIREPSALDASRDQVVVAVGARGARALIEPELRARGFVEGESAWFAS